MTVTGPRWRGVVVCFMHDVDADSVQWLNHERFFCEILVSHRNFLPRKFGAIQYGYVIVKCARSFNG